MKRALCIAPAFAMLLCVPSLPQAAMQKHSVEFGFYATSADFDDELNVRNRIGLGGRFGFAFAPMHELELSLDYILTHDNIGENLDVELSTFEIGYVFNPIPRATVSPFLMVGAGSQQLRASRPIFIFYEKEISNNTDPLAYAGAGVRFFIGSEVNIRVEGRAVEVFPDGLSGDKLVNYALNLGLGWVVGGR